jgi:hypothetical protein
VSIFASPDKRRHAAFGAGESWEEMRGIRHLIIDKIRSVGFCKRFSNASKIDTKQGGNFCKEKSAKTFFCNDSLFDSVVVAI